MGGCLPAMLLLTLHNLHSSGIGAAIAKAFSAAGHPLLLLSRRVGEFTAAFAGGCGPASSMRLN